MKNVITESLRIREGLTGILGDEAVSLKDLVRQDAELTKLFKHDDASSDMALIFSEFTPDGEVLPLSWVKQLERYATEPMTVVRVASNMVADVRKALA